MSEVYWQFQGQFVNLAFSRVARSSTQVGVQTILGVQVLLRVSGASQ